MPRWAEIYRSGVFPPKSHSKVKEVWTHGQKAGVLWQLFKKHLLRICYELDSIHPFIQSFRQYNFTEPVAGSGIHHARIPAKPYPHWAYLLWGNRVIRTSLGMVEEWHGQCDRGFHRCCFPQGSVVRGMHRQWRSL